MKERVRYEHRQVGWVTVILLFAIAAAISIAAGITAPSERLLSYSFVPILMVVAALFSTLTVRVTDKRMMWFFGVSGIGRSVAVSEIASIRPIKTSILEGWGVHLTWHGWLWNVSGFNAVQIVLRSGTRFAVGTPEPQAVIDAVQSAGGGTGS
ncbi:MAG: hypothetical protein ABSE64_13395 [Vulcanimicrobiaceae bacterium]